MPRNHSVDIPFHLILSHLDVPVIAVDLDREVVYATPSAEQAFDYKPGEMYGLKLARIFPKMHDDQTADTVFEHATAGKFTVVSNPIFMNDEMVGTLISVHPSHEENGVTQTKEYKRLAAHMEAVFETSSDGIWITDGNGVVLDINKASENLNSIYAEQAIGKNVAELVKESLIDRSATLEVLKKKRRISVLQQVRKTGRQLIVTGTPTFNEDGSVGLVVLNERDITDLNELRSTLAQTRKAKEKAEAELTGLSLMELKKGHVVAESSSMRKAMETAQKLAKFETSEILLMGESGTGKGLLAKFIHDTSPRRDKPFIQVNCATLPETLFEAELFGYEKGAFTGASEQGKSGMFELAAGGTFFLDEVGEIPLDMQAKLLKCLDDHEYYPLGASQPKRVNCIIVAATNRNLEALVEHKEFRKDLLYRLNTFTVNIPPLRQRPEDVFELTNHYLKQFNTIFKTSKRIGTVGMKIMQKYPFPGNVRELIGVLKKAVVICEEENLDEYLEDLFERTGEKGREIGTMPEEVGRLERKMLRQAMTACSNTREMAGYLGISQPTVVRKMKRYNLRDS